MCSVNVDFIILFFSFYGFKNKAKFYNEVGKKYTFWSGTIFTSSRFLGKIPSKVKSRLSAD